MNRQLEAQGQGQPRRLSTRAGALRSAVLWAWAGARARTVRHPRQGGGNPLYRGFIVVLSCWSSLGLAAASRPAVTLLPWQNLAVVAEDWQRAKEALKQSRQAWGSSLLTELQSMRAYALSATPPSAAATGNPGGAPSSGGLRPPLPPNLGAFLDQSLVGRLKASPELATTPLTITPLVCSLANAYLVMVSLHHRDQRQLITAGHHVVYKAAWAKAAKDKTLPATLATALNQAWLRAEASWRAKPQRSASALKLGLGLRQESTRRDHGSNLCLQQLVAEKLASEGFVTTALIGAEDMAGLDQLWPNPSTLLRATRHLQLTWETPLGGAPRPRQSLPVNLTLHSAHAEAVFAGHTSPGTKTEAKLGFTAEGTVSFDLPAELLAFIKREEEALALETPPRIAAINRAWVYLDKGRAYGLRMNDRLVVAGGSNPIAGHVVGYFGPELKLTRADGSMIHEGAIVFIRQGQRQTKLGQELAFDPKAYPTPWPPRNPAGR